MNVLNVNEEHYFKQYKNARKKFGTSMFNFFLL